MLMAARLNGGEDPGFRRRDVMARFFEGPGCLLVQKRVARASSCLTSQRSGLATTRPCGHLGASRLATAVAGASREESQLPSEVPAFGTEVETPAFR